MYSIKLILSLILIAVIAGFTFIYFGMFNMAANNKHWDMTTNFLEMVRNRSISVSAEGIVVPDLSDSARVKRGAANYDAMCMQCHLAPGVKTSELHVGMYPKPPRMYMNEEFAKNPNETFWIIKNGIKMTGMPAWGINNSDEQIWDMIATIKAMKTMSAAQYKQLVSSGAHTHKGDAHGGSMDSGEDSHDDGNEKQDGHHGGGAAGQQQSGHHGGGATKQKQSGHNDDGHSH